MHDAAHLRRLQLMLDPIDHYQTCADVTNAVNVGTCIGPVPRYGSVLVYATTTSLWVCQHISSNVRYGSVF